MNSNAWEFLHEVKWNGLVMGKMTFIEGFMYNSYSDKGIFNMFYSYHFESDSLCNLGTLVLISLLTLLLGIERNKLVHLHCWKLCEIGSARNLLLNAMECKVWLFNYGKLIVHYFCSNWYNFLLIISMWSELLSRHDN